MAHILTPRMPRAALRSATPHMSLRRLSSLASTSASSPPRIAIVGGGPAGLVLGALLHARRIPFTVYELRARPTAREWAQPSGMLDLHAHDGLRALRACGLYDAFLPLTGECSEEFIIADSDGAPMQMGSGEGEVVPEGKKRKDREAASRPEISRNNLTKLLLTKVPEESVRWGCKLQTATWRDDGTTTLAFGSGETGEYDLVVGADGAWSRVRTLLTAVRPRYGNAQIITATIRGITSQYPRLAALVGSGSYMALGFRHAVVSQRGPLDSARLYLWLTTTDEKLGVTSGLAAQSPLSAKAILLDNDKYLGRFGPVVKELVATALEEEAARESDRLDVRALYALPYGLRWEGRRGVTLVGDAAHLMLPNGEGVNQAMLDATLLAEHVVQAWEESGGEGTRFGEVLKPLVDGFEEDMAARAVRVGAETEQLLGMMLGEDATGQMGRFFEEHGDK